MKKKYLIHNNIKASTLFYRFFEDQVEQSPGAKAAIHNDSAITYENLNRMANILARALKSRGICTGELVALLSHRGFYFLISIIGIFKAGAAYLPLDPLHPSERQLHILKHSRVRFVVITKEFQEKMEEVLWNIPTEERPALVVLEEVLEEWSLKPGSNLRSTSGELAYVIYTSGSTGKPKGAMIEQEGMVNHLFAKIQELEISAEDRIIQNASQCFDISVWQYLSCLLTGGCVYIVDDDIAHDPNKLLSYTESNKITLLEVVPSLLQAMLDGIESGKLMKPCLESLRWLIVTGEALIPELARRWFLHYLGIPLMNAYGPTECSDDVTHYFIYKAPEKDVIYMPIGKAIINTRLYVMKEEGEKFVQCSTGEPGELWVAGICVGRGYLNDVELSARNFPVWSLDDISESRIYRTGDSVRLLPDENIEFMGRIDRQIKVHGFRVELGEIESLISKYPGIKNCVVKAVDIYELQSNLVARQPVMDTNDKENHHKSVIAYFISDGHQRASELRNYLSRFLPYYMVPAHFIKMEYFPLNPNGKVDYNRLPNPIGIRPNLEIAYSAPSDELEVTLAKIWEEVLKISGIGRHDSFFELGGDSLLAMQVLNRLRKSLQMDIQYKIIYEERTIEELSKYIRLEKGKKEFHLPPLTAYPPRRRYPLTYAQKRIWFVCQMQKENPFYNFAGILYIKGKYDMEVFHRAWNDILRRHIILNTRFANVGGIPYQAIDNPPNFESPMTDLRNYPTHERNRLLIDLATKESQIPFALENERLIRFRLYLLNDNEYAVLLVMHEIILDGWGACILINEFGRLYDSYLDGREPELLPPVMIQFKDFAIWEEMHLGKEVWRQHEVYWRQKLSGELPILELPFDYPRPSQMDYKGNSVGLILNIDLSEKIKKLTGEVNVTLFTVLSACFKLLLHYYSGQDDIIIGSPIVNRNTKETENIVGFQINMITFRTDMSRNPTFFELLERESQTISEAISHADYPFIELLELINPTRDTTVSPIFQVMFNMLNFPYKSESLENIELHFREIDTQYTKYDISFYAQEQAGQIYLQFSYLIALFQRNTIERIMNNFETIIKIVINEPGLNIANIDFLPKKEKELLLLKFNSLEILPLKKGSIINLFKEQALKTTDAAAYIFKDQIITYGLLDKQSTGTANYLKARGCARGELVALYAKKSMKMIVGILGILKAGAAYVPLEPAYPLAILQDILDDVNARHMMVDDESEILDFPGSCVIRMYPEQMEIQMEMSEDWAFNTRNYAYEESLFNVLYTSSSTGKPKGVMILQEAVLNRLSWMWRAYPFRNSDVLLFHKSFALVGASWELLGGLLEGIPTVMITREEQQDVINLCLLILKHHISYFHASPPLIKGLQEYISENGIGLVSLRIATTSAEPISPQLVNKWNMSVPGAPLLNLYGLTECSSNISVYDTWEMDKDCRNVPLGKPLDNVCINIINSYMNLSPIGVVGEICVTGACVALGYLNNVELTKKKFIKQSLDRRAILFQTGDYGRWTNDGVLEYIGRRDEQVKIRGYRIELLEVERIIEKYNDVKKAAVTAVELGSDEKELVAYIMSSVDLDVNCIRSFLEEFLPGYMIPTQYIKMEDFPLTHNGKIDKKNLPLSEELIMKIRGGYCPPRDEFDEKMVKIWERVLERERIGIRDNFFDIGGHSLKASQLTASIQKHLNIGIELRIIFEYPTIEVLTDRIKELSKKTVNIEIKNLSIDRVEMKEYYRLSSAQKRLYFIQEMDLKSTAYNRPMVLELEGDIDIDKLKKVFFQLIKRHECLRTAFVQLGDIYVQRVYDKVDFDIEYYDLIADNENIENSIIRQFVRPFDLSHTPLIRVGLIKISERKYILMIDLHHIIADGISQQLLNKEFTAILYGNELPTIDIQYKDYAEWQNSDIYQKRIKNQQTFWLKEYTGEISLLNLPTDYKRSNMPAIKGKKLAFHIEEGLTDKIKQFLSGTDITLYMMLLAVYNILLFIYTRQQDIVVGSPIAGRWHEDLQNIVGMFVNMLPMRNRPNPVKTFKEFLNEVKINSINAFENQEYQFDDLVENLTIQRYLNRRPLVETVFTLQNTFQAADSQYPSSLGNEPHVKLYPIESNSIKFDLTLDAFEEKESILMWWTYATELFKDVTIENLKKHYIEILGQVLENKDIRLKDIKISHSLISAGSNPWNTEQGDFGF